MAPWHYLVSYPYLPHAIFPRVNVNYVKHFLIYVNFSIIEGGMQGSDN